MSSFTPGSDRRVDAAAQIREVYAVEWGEYEQRDVVAVFATKEQAEAFIAAANEREPLWGMYLAHRPLQLCERDEDALCLWPLGGELPDAD